MGESKKNRVSTFFLSACTGIHMGNAFEELPKVVLYVLYIVICSRGIRE